MTQQQRRITSNLIGALSNLFKGKITKSSEKKGNSNINPGNCSQIKSYPKGNTKVYTRTDYQDIIRNEIIRRRTGITDIVEKITRLKWNWARPTLRINDGHWLTKKQRQIFCRRRKLVISSRQDWKIQRETYVQET